MVVYAGPPFSGNVSWISRTEHAPRVHTASMICISNGVSFGDFISNYMCNQSNYTHSWIASFFCNWLGDRGAVPTEERQVRFFSVEHRRNLSYFAHLSS